MTFDSLGLPCGCPNENLVLIQYRYDHPESFDGWSEMHCDLCKKRWGRWTKRELKEDESEPRYGKFREGK